MNTMTHSVRRLLVLSLFSIGLAAASFAQAAEQRFSGPRNTIPQTRAQVSNHSFEGLRASTDDTSVCSTVRIKHYGHPGKGVDRIEGSGAPCSKTRLSTR